ncbi:MAG TPA: ABC transporter substrate-binding protein [Streptosporangiaceae bacterium]|nr:ABC transporter substrate-binding protein [Streptosporangiaceae bacterium]
MRTLRLQIAAAGLLAVTTSVAGCTSAATATVASLSGVGPITFAIGKLDTGSYLPGLIRQWNAAHPGQRVTLIPLPDEADDQHAQLVANLQAKSSLYDVISLDVIWTAEFAANGWIVPLNPGSLPLAGLLRPTVATASYQGKLYTVPFTSNADLLYYRKDILAAAGRQPPRTWAQLAELARTLAPRYGMAGYAGQFAPYEGLTVNFAEAVQSAGGSILSPDSTRVTLDSPQARAGLRFLSSGFRQGWIPRAALNYDEATSQRAFEAGKLLFMNNWPYVYGQASSPGTGSKVAGRFGVTMLPGPDGPGSSSLGGENLAISAFSRHQVTALAFIKFLTSISSERRILIDASLPPVWTRLYTDPALIRRFPYLPVLEKAILTAKPRPGIPNYNQLSLAISGTIHQALAAGWPAGPTITALSRKLSSVIRMAGTSPLPGAHARRRGPRTHGSGKAIACLGGNGPLRTGPLRAAEPSRRLSRPGQAPRPAPAGQAAAGLSRIRQRSLHAPAGPAARLSLGRGGAAHSSGGEYIPARFWRHFL